MKKVVRLTENDLARIIKRVIAEQAAVVGAPGTPAMGNEPMTPEEQKDNEMLASTINNIGLPMDAASIDELDACPVEDETVDPKVRPFFDAIKQKVESMDVNSLMAELKNVLSIKRRMKRGQMSEQAAAGLAIAGIAIPGWAIAVVAGLVVILIVKTIINRTKGNKSYRRKKRHLKHGCHSKKNRNRIKSFLNN
jgi:ribosomal protein L12E/L44/L45/RPP1/RPP2